MAGRRFALNDFLHRFGGHVGYAVGGRFPRRGYATEILRQSPMHLSAEGVDPVPVTCDNEHAGSAAVIEACGGVLENVVPQEVGAPKRRYWIHHA